MNKQYKIGDEVLVRGIINSEVRHGGIHVLHDGVDAFYTLDQIHEPQKVVVPKFVAEWIESHKESFSDASAIDMYDNLTSDNRSGYYHEVWLWVIAHHHDFIKAWHDGYEIEKEKLYYVNIANIYHGDFGYSEMYDNYSFYNKSDATEIRFELTESEIKTYHEWAWQFAKEVE